MARNTYWHELEQEILHRCGSGGSWHAELTLLKKYTTDVPEIGVSLPSGPDHGMWRVDILCRSDEAPFEPLIFSVTDAYVHDICVLLLELERMPEHLRAVFLSMLLELRCVHQSTYSRAGE